MLSALSKHNALDHPIIVISQKDNEMFKYYSDVVFKTNVFRKIAIQATMTKVDDVYHYALDLQFLIDEAKRNQKHLNNFSKIKASQSEALVCLLAFEQNQYKLVFA